MPFVDDLQLNKTTGFVDDLGLSPSVAPVSAPPPLSLRNPVDDQRAMRIYPQPDVAHIRPNAITPQSFVTTPKQGTSLTSLLGLSRQPTNEENAREKDRAANILAMSKETKLPPHFVEANYDALTQKLGMRDQPTSQEMLDAGMKAGVVAGMITNPITTAIGLASYAGAKETESLGTQLIQKRQAKLFQGHELKDLLDNPSLSASAAEIILPGFVAWMGIGPWLKKMDAWEKQVVFKSISAQVKEGMTNAEIKAAWRDPANRERILKEYAGVGKKEQINAIKQERNVAEQSGGVVPAIKAGEAVTFVDDLNLGKSLPLNRIIPPAPSEQTTGTPGATAKEAGGSLDQPAATSGGKRAISDDAMDYIDNARREHTIEIANEFSKKGGAKVTDGGTTYYVHKSVKEPGKIQVTVTDSAGPVRDFQSDNLRTALKELTEENLPVSRYSRPDLPDTALMDVFPKGGEYVYSYRSRPMSIGTQPEGFIRGEKGGKWGKVVYDRPLTAAEIKQFELIPEKFTEKSPSPLPEAGAKVAAPPRKSLARNPMHPVSREIKKMGGLKLGVSKDIPKGIVGHGLYADYDKNTIKDLVRIYGPGIVSKKGALSLDEAAEQLGYEDGNALMTALLDPKRGLNMRSRIEGNNDAYELNLERKIEEDAYADAERAVSYFENEEGLDPGAIESRYADIIAHVIKTSRESGVSIPDEAAAAAELTDFFDEVSATPRNLSHLKNDTGTLQGMSYEEDFNLSSPGLQENTGVLHGRVASKAKTRDVFEADTGGYAPPRKPTVEERKVYAENPKLALELPEIVEFAQRAMEGKFPTVKRFLGQAIGRFYPGSGKIAIINNLDLDTMSRVLAHEIGHLADWLPDKDMRKGNILGRVGSIPHYLKSLLEEYPDSPNAILTDKDRIRLRKEAGKQVTAESLTDGKIVEEITRTVPKYEEMAITSDMILDILRGRTNEPDVLLRFLQEVDGTTKKAIAKQALQNLVDETLAGLTGKKIVGYETVTERIIRPSRTKTEESAATAKRYRELLKAEILKRKLYEKEVITQELKNLTIKWKPFTPGADKYTQYRFSSKELYADAVSVLMNDTGLLWETAPTFQKAFLNYFEKKPALKSIYDEIQTRRADPNAVLEQRRLFERGMAEEGARLRQRQEELQKKRQTLTPSLLWGAARRAFGAQNIRALELMEKARAEGRVIPDSQRLDYWTEELPYINSEVYSWQRSVEIDIIKKAQAGGIDLIDLHEYMILKRAATERKGIYNPGGIGDVFAEKQLSYMKSQVGAEKFANIERIVKSFRTLYEAKVLTIIKNANFLPSELVKSMMENPNYATFANLEYLVDKHFGAGTGAKIYKQYGMLGKVDNVFIQTILKGSALIRAARHHEVKMALIKSPEISAVMARRGPKGVGWMNPKDPDMGLIVASPEGKTQGYYIDKEIAELWNQSPDKASVVSRARLATLGLIKGFLGKAFIKWNIPWMLANPIRDVLATYKKVPETRGYLLKGYKNTLGDAFRAAMDLLPERERKLLEEKALVRDRFYQGEGNMFAVEREFLKNVDTPDYSGKIASPILTAAHWLKKHEYYFVVPAMGRGLEIFGKAGERLGKMAADEAIRLRSEATGAQVADQRRTHLVRTRAGTPNSYAQGLLHTLTEAMFPFSNIALQDMRSSIEAFREDKSGYTVKTVVLNVLPKILFWGMVAGYFGEDIKKVASRVGKYYRRMYGVLPLFTYGDETVALTLPQDYMGQTIGALASSALDGDFTGTMGSLGLVTGGQPYNLNPFISSAMDWINYYSNGVAPVNKFYGSKMMTDDEAKAGGKYAAEVLSRDLWNQFFGTMIYRIPGSSGKPNMSDFEKVLSLPVLNGLGRFFRITNQGSLESLTEASDTVDKQRAIENINIKRAIVKNLAEGSPVTPDQLFVNLVNQGAIQHKLYGGVNQALSAFKTKYNNIVLMKANNPLLRAYMTAGSKEAKDAVLNEALKGNR